MSKRLMIAAIAVCFALIACERATRDIGGKSKSSDSPMFTAVEQVSVMPGFSNVMEIAPKTEQGIDGQKLFVATCSPCHQVTGLGIPGAFPPLDGSEWVQSDRTDRMASIMLYGLMGPIEVKGSPFANVMAPQGHLKDEELAAIASYVRSAWSNKAAPIEPSVFAEARKYWGLRGSLTVPELLAK